MSNASLGAVAFIAQVSQLLWAVPLAVWADRGSRKKVAAVALLVFACLRHPDGDLAQRLGVRLPLSRRLRRHRGEQHGAQLVPLGRLPDRVARADLQLAQPVRPAVADDRDPDLRLRRDRLAQLALRPAGGAGRDSARLRPLHAARAREGRQREQPHPQGLGHGPPQPAGEGAPRPARLGRDPAAAGPLPLLRARGGGHPGLRRDRCAAVRQPVLHRQVPPRHGVTRARSTPSSAWPPSSGSRWPTSSATATSAAPRSGRSSSPASASRPTAGSSSCRSTCPSSGCA